MDCSCVVLLISGKNGQSAARPTSPIVGFKGGSFIGLREFVEERFEGGWRELFVPDLPKDLCSLEG